MQLLTQNRDEMTTTSEQVYFREPWETKDKKKRKIKTKINITDYLKKQVSDMLIMYDIKNFFKLDS